MGKTATFGEKLLFAVFVYTSIFVNFDGGALPPILGFLEESLGVPPAQQGLLGGCAYIGLSLACPLAGPILQHLPTRMVLVVSLALNAFFCFLFGLAPSRVYAFLARLGVGFTQSVFVVMNPVWVECHAPRQYATTWLSIIQASVPLGIMVGYCLSGYLALVFKASWRLAFFIQGLALIPPLLVFLFSPKQVLSISHLDDEESDNEIDTKQTTKTNDFHKPGTAVSAHEVMFKGPRSDDPPSPVVTRTRAGSTTAAMVVVRSFSRMGQVRVPNPIAGPMEIEMHNTKPASPEHTSQPHPPQHRPRGLAHRSSVPFMTKKSSSMVQYTFWQQMKILLTSPMFIWVVFALSALYFVVTSIQYWITVYLIEDIKTPRSLVLTAFSVASLTGPTLGVVAGGIFIDWVGGYKKTKKCLGILTLFGALAFMFALPAGFINDFWTIISLLWMTLFFGGCILAPATGIVISAVEKQIMPFASSMSMLTYNVLGFGAGPMVTGAVYQYFGMRWCIRTALGWGVFGFVGLLIAWVAAIRLEKQHPEIEAQMDSNLEFVTRRTSIFAPPEELDLSVQEDDTAQA